MQERQKGLLLTAIGVLVLSPDALVLRWLNADAMQVLAWRGLLMAIGLGLLLVWRYRSELPAAARRCGWTGIGCALCYGISTLGFVQAISLAGAANTLLILSIAPLIAAALAWCFLGERLALRTLLAILICLGGVLLIVADRSPGNSLAGNAWALASATLLAGNFTLARSRPRVDMSPSLVPGALLVSLLGFAFGGTPALSAPQWAGLAFMAGVLLPLAFMLIQLGPRRISGTEVGLLLLLEVVLGPLWVWWLLDEVPGDQVLLGGAIIFLALLGHSLLSWRRGPSSASV
ncbi:EamA domain-containing membrane protein RarD [Pseudomonas guineae]|uniref:EamA domain-containing membrane protein RarD n=1 Tax=Pseudomonas guineae TaxID=425504 RepID=A0A1I3FC58_9PSED|nr:DMT family transporter [Pseudomonas guineae]SFI08732.1 EamA domain-containing membrane protein RarD [Pseudomonas guineae]